MQQFQLKHLSFPPPFPQSSLLSAILGELPLEKGVLKVSGQLSYACQQPWVFPGTIRGNILFGKELDLGKYEKVLQACALKRVSGPAYTLTTWLNDRDWLTTPQGHFNPNHFKTNYHYVLWIIHNQYVYMQRGNQFRNSHVNQNLVLFRIAQPRSSLIQTLHHFQCIL